MDLVRRLGDELPMAVCCLDEEGAWGTALRTERIDVHALGRTAGFHPALGRAIARVAEQHRADVIHCHHYSPFVYSALARFWQPHLRVVFTEHGRLSDAPPSTRRRAANVVLARTRFLGAAVSAHLKQHMVAEGFPDRKIAVIYNGIDVGPESSAGDRAAIRRDLGIPAEMLAIGTVARLDPVKDLATLIAAIGELARSRPTVLFVIGDGEERANLEAFAHAAGAPVRFMGHREDARTLLAGCDLYANSSVHEGISLTILEAMAAGLPVVATAVGGTPEILDATCGRLVPSRDPGALAAALGELASQAELRHSLGVAARRRVEARFTIDRMVAEYRETYLRAA